MMLTMFCSVFLCTVSIILVVVLFIFYQWNFLYVQFKKDHLQDALYRMSEEIRYRQLSPPLTDQEQKTLSKFALREGVAIRWIGNAEEVFLDMLPDEPDSSRWMQIPSWNETSQLGKLMVVWSTESEDNYPGYSIISKVNHILMQSVLVGAFFAFLISLLVSYKLMRPIGRIVHISDDIYLRRKIALIDEEGTGDARRIAKGINFLVHQLNEQEKWRQVMMEDLAHELRTPLMLVSNQIEAISDGIFEPNQLRMEKILRDLSRLTRLVSDIERIVQAQSARFELHLEEIDVVPVIKQAIASLEEAYKAKNMEIELITPKIPCPVLVDVDKMTQVFVNIVYNAIKYTHEGGKIEIITEHERETGRIVVHVKDNGIGISKEELPKIFERFYRIDKSQSREAGGSGLGLTITKRLIESHDGQIDVYSKPGCGSVFIVTIPASTL